MSPYKCVHVVGVFRLQVLSMRSELGSANHRDSFHMRVTPLQVNVSAIAYNRLIPSELVDMNLNHINVSAFKSDLAKLCKLHRRGRAIVLMCHCVPKLCHGVRIATAIFG